MTAEQPAASWQAQHVLRFLCVAGMVLVHALFWIGTSGGRLLLDPQTSLHGVVRAGMIVGVFPLLLPFTAGCALRLRLPSDGYPSPAAWLRLAAQALFLATLGVVMNVLAAGWYARWAWNVLQFVGLSFMVIGALLLLRSVWPLAAAGLAVLIASDPLREGLAAGSRGVWGRILLGDPNDFHTWPFVPWFSTVVFGWLVAHAYLATGGDRRFRWRLGGLGAAVVAAVAIFGKITPAFDADNLIGPAVMGPPALSTLGLMGIAAVLTAVLTAACAGRSFRRYGIVRCYSHGILWIYVAHTIAGVRLSRYLFRHIDQYSLVHRPGSGASLALILGFPAFLLLLSWLVGLLTIRWLRGKWIHIRLRRVRPARREPLHSHARAS